jgi:hypothetical protein
MTALTASPDYDNATDDAPARCLHCNAQLIRGVDLMRDLWVHAESERAECAPRGLSLAAALTSKNPPKGRPAVNTVTAGFTRRAVIVVPDTADMVTDSPAILAAVDAMRDRRAAYRAACAMTAPEDETRGARAHRRNMMRDAEVRYQHTTAEVERAIRRRNPGATEAQIQELSRSF